MCGFVGIWGPKFAERAELLSNMAKLISHRGPDGCGRWENDNLFLIHYRLALLDTSAAGDQPMQLPFVENGKGPVIAFNGTIYNYLELSETLSALPVSTGDTEVLLRLLAEKGVAALPSLNGTWAFAYFDPREQSLLLCRDRFGIKPLYWRLWGRHLVFASEIPALLDLDTLTGQIDIGGSRSSGHQDDSINSKALSSFLVDRQLDYSTETLFHNIYQLRPGSWVKFRADDFTRVYQQRQYWDLAPARVTPHRGDADELLELIDDAVNIRLRADVSIGYLLSGGLDSSAVVSAASLALDGKLHAYTLRYPQNNDESEQAHKIAEHCRLQRLETVEPGSQDLEPDLRNLLRVQGEPFADGSMLAHYKLMAAVAASGHRVVLGGQGGDEALAGYIPTFSRARAADCLLQGSLVEARSNVISLVKGGLNALWHTLPARWRSEMYQWRVRNRVGHWLNGSLVALSEPRYQKEHFSCRLKDYMCSARNRWTLPGFLHYEDRNAMHHGLEARAPFMDYRLMLWGLSCPDHLLVKNGVGKQILRCALLKRLPESIVRAPLKQSMPAPVQHWMRHNLDLVMSSLEIAEHRLGLENRKTVETRFLSACKGRQPALAAYQWDLLWRIMIAALWADEFKVSLR